MQQEGGLTDLLRIFLLTVILTFIGCLMVLMLFPMYKMDDLLKMYLDGVITGPGIARLFDSDKFSTLIFTVTSRLYFISFIVIIAMMMLATYARFLQMERGRGGHRRGRRPKMYASAYGKKKK